MDTLSEPAVREIQACANETWPAGRHCTLELGADGALGVAVRDERTDCELYARLWDPAFLEPALTANENVHRLERAIDFLALPQEWEPYEVAPDEWVSKLDSGLRSDVKPAGDLLDVGPMGGSTIFPFRLLASIDERRVQASPEDVLSVREKTRVSPIGWGIPREVAEAVLAGPLPDDCPYNLLVSLQSVDRSNGHVKRDPDTPQLVVDGEGKGYWSLGGPGNEASGKGMQVGFSITTPFYGTWLLLERSPSKLHPSHRRSPELVRGVGALIQAAAEYLVLQTANPGTPMQRRHGQLESLLAQAVEGID